MSQPRSIKRTLASVLCLVLASATPAAANTATGTSCGPDLSGFLSSAAAGTYSSSALTVSLNASASLANPAISSRKNSSQVITVNFTAYDQNGAQLTPTLSSPLQVAIYSEPSSITAAGTPISGKGPYAMTIKSGSSFSFSYTGSYVHRPPVVTAWMNTGQLNTCTGTMAKAIGLQAIPLATTPQSTGTKSYRTATNCTTGKGAACAANNVLTSGLSINAAVGFGPSIPGSGVAAAKPKSSNFASFTIDTGSIGSVAPLDELGPNVIGPGPPAWKYYDSSGYEFAGYIYLAPVTFSMGTAKPSSYPIRVLGVAASNCATGMPCSTAPEFANFHYMGVGISREENTSADPFVSPGDNALLEIAPGDAMPMSPGYMLSGGSIQAGITTATAAGYSKQQLAPNSSNLGDWGPAAGCVSFPTPSLPPAPPLCGSMLMDVGIDQMYISVLKGNMPAAAVGGLSPSQSISISSPNPTSPSLSYTFAAGSKGANGQPSPAPTGRAPSFVSLFSSEAENTGQVFINTGRHVLFGSNYMLNAQKGQVGFKTLAHPLR